MNALIQPSHVLPSGLAGTPFVDLEPARSRLGYPGLEPSLPVIDIEIFDDSASITLAGDGADPIGGRYRESMKAVLHVAKSVKSDRQKIAVLHFDQPSEGDLEVTPLRSRRLRPLLVEAMRTPREGYGSSDLGPSLDAAERIAARHSDHEVRLTVFSDWALLGDPDIFDRLRAFPGEVHAVSLDREPPLELHGTNISITKMHHDDPGELAAEALFRSLTASRPGARRNAAFMDRTKPSIPPLSAV